MNRSAQGFVVAMLGAMCLGLGLSDRYLRYVKEWMQWPLVASAIVLLGLGLWLLWRPESSDGPSRAPLSAWLLMGPVLASFVVNPPALGSYAADRNRVGIAADKDYGTLDKAGVIEMPVGEYQGRATWDDTLHGQRLALTGFVTRDRQGWYVTRLAVSCCAADAVAFRVRVDAPDVAAPKVNSWVRVVGSWPGAAESGATDGANPEAVVIGAEEVQRVAAPAQPYES